MSTPNPPPSDPSRRRWLVAAPAAVLVLGVAAHQLSWATRAADATALAFGSLVDRRLERWQVLRVHPMHLGAVPIVLATARGERYQVDVLARDPSGPEGVASTERLSLFVVNSPDTSAPAGMRSTDEEQGLGAMMLARALAAEPIPPGLLSHAQRRQQHPRGAFAVPLV